MLNKKNMVFSRSSAVSQECLVQLEFVGNLDIAIQKMKRDKKYSLNEEESLQLKCCLLFLYGMSYSSISNHLNIEEYIVKQYLWNKDFWNLLSFEYQTLFQMNQLRLLKNITPDHTNFIMKKEDVKEILDQLQPIGVVQKRYLALCRAVLIDNITTLEELESLIGLSKDTIRKYINDLSNTESFLPNSIIQLLEEKTKTFCRFTITSALKDQYYKLVVDLYLSGRYSHENMCEITGLENTAIRSILNQHAKRILDEETYLQLISHKKYMNSLCSKYKQNMIRDQRMIAVVKPEIVYVSFEDYRLLTNLIHFLTEYYDISIKDPKETFMANVVYLLANENNLRRLLKEEAFIKIWSSLQIEQLLFEGEISKKSEFIISITKSFFINDLDLDATAEKEQISIESLIRILQNGYIKTSYGVIVYEYIKKAIFLYRIEKKNKRREKEGIARQLTNHWNNNIL